MKRTLTICALLLAAMIGLQARADAPTTYFPYPTAPDDAGSLRERCNYVVMHFWDRCNFKSAFSSLDKMNGAVGDFLSYMPHTQADTAHMAVNILLDKVKKDPKATLALARMAEGWIYSDSSRYVSEELYAPFAEAVARNKKIPQADRARFEAQHKILSSSQKGMPWPEMKLVDVAGQKHSFAEITTPNIIVMFSDPDCTDCMLAKARLSADYNANDLIQKGLLTIVTIYPGDYNDWKDKAASYPDNWTVWASPDADEYFALPDLPMLVFVGGDHRIIAKDVIVDNLKNAFQLLNQQNSAN